MSTTISPTIDDTILVRLKDGTEVTGKFDIHPMADECVYNEHGFPISLDGAKVLKIVQKGRFSK